MESSLSHNLLFVHHDIFFQFKYQYPYLVLKTLRKNGKQNLSIFFLKFIYQRTTMRLGRIILRSSTTAAQKQILIRK